MSETKHTPGPWELLFNEVIAGGAVICTVCFADDFPCIAGDSEEDEAAERAEVDLECAANARLIAAAPDLLAELVKMRKRFYAALVSTGTDAEFARAAVADADLAIKRATEA